MDLNLSRSNGTVSTKIYDKRNDFDFDIVNFPFFDGDVLRRTSYGVFISQLTRFARASSNVNDFNCRHKALTAKLLRQGYRYHKLRKTFSKFYRRHSGLVEKYNVSLRKLLQQGISMVAGLCHFVFSPEITPRKTTKRRHAKRRNNAMQKTK